LHERILIQDDLELYRLNLNEAKKNSSVKEKRFIQRKMLKNLVYRVFGTHTEVTHNQYGKPLLVGHQGNISVSHNKEWIIMLYSPARNVGVDIESVQERILRLQERFLQPDEMKEFRENPFWITLAWCAKESVLKCIGFKKISFRRDLRILSIDKNKLQMVVKSTWAEKPGLFKVQWMESDQNIIALAYEMEETGLG